MPEDLPGHTHVNLPDGTLAPLGFWKTEWSDNGNAAAPWHAPLRDLFGSGMKALQRQSEADNAANMAKASGNAQPALTEAERQRSREIERKRLEREMTLLHSVELPKIAADLAAQRAALSPLSVPVNKIDVAAAAMRTEIRNYVRGLAGDKLQVVLANADPEMLDALLSAPAYLSGLSQGTLDSLKERRLRTLHPKALASIEHGEAALKTVQRVADAARRGTGARLLPLLPIPETELQPKGRSWA
jgi:hypothetical protein